MQFESFRRDMPTINISALMDVVFILLIFVVLSANFDRLKTLNVVLPSAANANESTPEAVVITMLPDGKILVFEEEISAEALLPHLKELRTRHDNLLLVSDGSVPLDQAVKIFDEAASAGFTSVSIATQRGTP